MKISKKELMEKFPSLNKFKDQKWLSEESIKSNCNYRSLPFKAAHEVINEIIEFSEKTKFSNHWESHFSIKIRLQQLQDLLLYFCEKTEQEKTLKGENITQQDPIHK